MKVCQSASYVKNTYHNYETGKRELPFELAVTPARFYDVSLNYIGGLTTVKRPRKVLQKIKRCHIITLFP